MNLLEVKQHIAQLNAHERAELAEFLESLEDDISPAWYSEIERRLELIKGGTAKLIPSEEAFERVRKALHQPL